MEGSDTGICVSALPFPEFYREEKIEMEGRKEERKDTDISAF